MHMLKLAAMLADARARRARRPVAFALINTANAILFAVLFIPLLTLGGGVLGAAAGFVGGWLLWGLAIGLAIAAYIPLSTRQPAQITFTPPPADPAQESKGHDD